MARNYDRKLNETDSTQRPTPPQSKAKISLSVLIKLVAEILMLELIFEKRTWMAMRTLNFELESQPRTQNGALTGDLDLDQRKYTSTRALDWKTLAAPETRTRIWWSRRRQLKIFTLCQRSCSFLCSVLLCVYVFLVCAGKGARWRGGRWAVECSSVCVLDSFGWSSPLCAAGLGVFV